MPQTDPQHKSKDPAHMRSASARQHQNGRRDQRERRAHRNGVAVAFLAVAILAIAGWFGYHQFVAVPKKSSTATEVATSVAHASSAEATLAATPMVPEISATPTIASYRDVTLRLPVATDDLTELEMHQASYSYALPMSTPLKIADTAKAQKAHGTKRPAEQPHGTDAVLNGSILQLWRSGRKGKPDTALDVGAKPGSSLLSPVDGTVVLVKKYKLYKKWPDIEIHVQPTGHPELDVVMIHVTDPNVVAGDKVVGGVTKIGHLRKLSDKMYLQLATYTAKNDGGNHTHIQVNNAQDPLYIKKKHLKGAITVQN